MMIQQVKTGLVLCLIMLAFSVHSFAQQQGAKAEMTVTRSVNTSNPIHEAIIAKYGNDEAKIGKAMKKVRALKTSGKRVMTAQEFVQWKQAVDTKMKGLTSNADKQKMRQLISKKTARIVILEDNI
jgi:hypothetical protein